MLLAVGTLALTLVACCTGVIDIEHASEIQAVPIITMAILGASLLLSLIATRAVPSQASASPLFGER